MKERTILHCDMNNFYASVECLHHPELRGKPVAVAGDPEQRHGIVLAKNFEAKAHGVKTGHPLWMARKLCRDILFVPPHYSLYLRYSRMAQKIYGEYTDQVEPFGLDECWLDVTGSAGLFGDGESIAKKLREQMKTQLGVTISVGVSYNKVFAKLGSDLKKPDATTVIRASDYRQTVWPLPVGDLLYVGNATRRKLEQYAIHTIGDLAAADTTFLQHTFGKVGLMLWSFANGADASPVSTICDSAPVKSIGNSTTTPKDLTTDEDVRITLYALCESVAERLRESGLCCATVQIALRDKNLFSYERQTVLPTPTSNSTDIFRAAFGLYQEHHSIGRHPLRSVGVRGCQLTVSGNEQLSLLPEEQKSQKLDALEHTVDHIRGRFGHSSIQRGIMLKDHSLSSLDPKNDHIIHPVGFLHA